MQRQRRQESGEEGEGGKADNVHGADQVAPRLRQDQGAQARSWHCESGCVPRSPAIPEAATLDVQHLEQPRRGSPSAARGLVIFLLVRSVT